MNTVENDPLIGVYEEAAQALDDWITTYAHEFCGKAHVRAARQRIEDGGGTIAYATRIREKLDLAIKAEKATR